LFNIFFRADTHWRRNGRTIEHRILRYHANYPLIYIRKEQLKAEQGQGRLITTNVEQLNSESASNQGRRPELLFSRGLG
jgi:hypothetical protein